MLDLVTSWTFTYYESRRWIYLVFSTDFDFSENYHRRYFAVIPFDCRNWPLAPSIIKISGMFCPHCDRWHFAYRTLLHRFIVATVFVDESFRHTQHGTLTFASHNFIIPRLYQSGLEFEELGTRLRKCRVEHQFLLLPATSFLVELASVTLLNR